MPALCPVLLPSVVLSIGAAFASPPEVRLPIKYHHQEHSLSCEVAALETVLDYYGVKISEAEILGKMPYDRTPRAKGIWGDPDAGFVGDIDGEMGITGYGIHWAALARLSSTWKRTSVIEGGSLKDLTAHLGLRRPVIVWGYDKSREVLKWKTADGRQVIGLKGEHTRIVFGFRGEAGSPTGFFVMDPETGPSFWTTQTFLENWDSLGRVGIVLYDEPPAKRAGHRST